MPLQLPPTLPKPQKKTDILSGLGTLINPDNININETDERIISNFCGDLLSRMKSGEKIYINKSLKTKLSLLRQFDLIYR